MVNKSEVQASLQQHQESGRETPREVIELLQVLLQRTPETFFPAASIWIQLRAEVKKILVYLHSEHAKHLQRESFTIAPENQMSLTEIDELLKMTGLSTGQNALAPADRTSPLFELQDEKYLTWNSAEPQTYRLMK